MKGDSYLGILSFAMIVDESIPIELSFPGFSRLG